MPIPHGPRPNIFPASCRVLDLSGADDPLWRAAALVSSLLPISSTEKCRLYLVHRGGRFWHLDRAAIFLNFAPRTVGFDPTLLENNSATYWSTILFRFLRLVVVVPLVEEVFWRGFLLRFVVDEHFERVPFGKFNWLSFAVVTVAFTFSHSRPDWPAAFITGALYNVVAYRTQSLASCVLAHAVSNLLLGLWIMQTRQWGFW